MPRYEVFVTWFDNDLVSSSDFPQGAGRGGCSRGGAALRTSSTSKPGRAGSLASVDSPGETGQPSLNICLEEFHLGPSSRLSFFCKSVIYMSRPNSFNRVRWYLSCFKEVWLKWNLFEFSNVWLIRIMHFLHFLNWIVFFWNLLVL